MATLEERVAFLEGRVGEHAQMLEGIRTAIVNLEHRMDRRFEGLELRLAAFEQRFQSLDRKLDERTDALDAKISRQFTWLVGIPVTTLVAIVAALLAR